MRSSLSSYLLEAGIGTVQKQAVGKGRNSNLSGKQKPPKHQLMTCVDSGDSEVFFVLACSVLLYRQLKHRSSAD